MDFEICHFVLLKLNTPMNSEEFQPLFHRFKNGDNITNLSMRSIRVHAFPPLIFPWDGSESDLTFLT